MSDSEQLKQQLVDCIRMLESSDIIDYNGHASTRAGDGRMFINIGTCQRSRTELATEIVMEQTPSKGAAHVNELRASATGPL